MNHRAKAFYAKGQTLPGLWRIATEGGEEVEIISSLEAGHWGYWAVVENGIYYLDITAKPAIAFFDVNTRRCYANFRSREPSSERSAGTGGLSGQRDNPLHTIGFVKRRYLMLVENFR